MTDTEKIADVVVAAVRAATLPLLERNAALDARIAILEARAPIPGPAGLNGKDAPSVDIDAIVARVAALVPPPKDGRDGQDGQPGRSVELAELVEVIAKQVDEAMSARPLPKDGIGITGALIDASGRLILTFTDGQTKDVGEVVGAKGQDGRDGMPAIGRPGMDGKDGKDGLDGLSFDDIEEVLEDGGRFVIRRYRRGERVKEFRHQTATVIYRGVWVAGKTYEIGDSVTLAGSTWIARDRTTSKPGDGATAWQLSVKAGRDGREGKPGPQGLNGSKGEKGDPGRNFS